MRATAATMGQDGSREGRLDVAVISADGGQRDEVADLLAAADISVSSRVSSSAELDGAPVGSVRVVVLVGDESRCLDEARALAERDGDARQVIVSRSIEPGAVRRVVSGGAAGFVWLAEAETALAPTVRAVAAGQLTIPLDRRAESAPVPLTTREKQILALVVMGLRNGEIAAKLFVAESTVKSHLSSAFAKLGVASRNEAVALILDPRAGVGTGILTIPTQQRRRSGR